jgi:HD superfamily phosphohydrolase
MVYLEKAKIYKDVIHNSIITTKIATSIIDNNIFQRLRNLHQLGVCYYVFPNANNTRFEHSLGTYHLAGRILVSLIANSDVNEINKSLIKVKFIKNYIIKKYNLGKTIDVLKTNNDAGKDTGKDTEIDVGKANNVDKSNNNVNKSNKDVNYDSNEDSNEDLNEDEDLIDLEILKINKCLLDDYLIELIKIAGLVHDIGHGPFSHMFDEWLGSIPELSNNNLIHHENRSILLLEMIINNSQFTHNNIIYKTADFIDMDAYNFMSSLIHPYIFPDAPKNFIYQIISNHLNDLDVDKLDYLCRDSYYLGIGTPIDLSRIIDHVHVINGNISFPEKTSYDIYKVYRTRYDLHKQFYNHKTVICIEYMMKTILEKLDNILKISENIKSNNINHFINLTDSVITTTSFIIQQLKPLNYDEIKPDIEFINNVLNDINTRKLYKCVHSSSYSVRQKININLVIKKILQSNKNVKLENIIPVIIKIGLIGGEKTHPFDNLYFYDKKKSSKILSTQEISHLMGSFFQEKLLFVISNKK